MRVLVIQDGGNFQLYRGPLVVWLKENDAGGLFKAARFIPKVSIAGGTCPVVANISP